MTIEIRPAERQQLKARVALSGPSGSGKTYSALLLARGLVGEKGRICVLDTEQSSSSMYAGLIATKAQPTGYDVAAMGAPYSPKAYAMALKAIAEAGYDAVVVDSISHEWYGEGGILEIVDNAKSGSGGRAGFSAWKMATPLHNKFVAALLNYPGHIIVTMRSKTEWVVENENGRNTPKKVGQAPVQRDGIEYEFQLGLDLSLERNMASVSKDRTGLFSGQNFTVSLEHGQKLAEFLSTGTLKPVPVKPEPADPRPNSPEDLGARPVEVEPEPEEEPDGDTDEGPAFLTPSQAKQLMTVAKGAGLSMKTLRKIAEEVGGSAKPEEIPASKFNALLAALNAQGGE